ncbi:beta-ketoacyl-[acyl-carrier-protein] synthase family protein (plasmid) [Streptomyces sp. BI20]|uniref:beta-ketoacyl-[acyl-carrier-protein] synthase family protein n=1 Tax=Streptomyces sp. BI20 TaxID=3403460 RepID=UPI003C72A221
MSVMKTNANGAEVVVTGMGMIGAAGVGVEAGWRRVLAGAPTAAPLAALAGCPVDFGCEVPGFDAPTALGARRASGTERFTQLALVACAEALRSACLEPTGRNPARTGVVLGTAAGGTAALEAGQAALVTGGPAAVPGRTMPAGLLSAAAGELSVEFGVRGVALTVTTACASGSMAIGVARDLIRSGTADVVLAGGTDAPLTPLNAAAYHRLRALSRRVEDPAGACRPFSASRDGFVIGEGAGVLVLESAAHARRRGAPVVARLSGYGTSADAHHATRPPADGAGARQAMEAALRDAGVAASAVGYVNAHGTSTVRNDLAEGAAIRAVLGGAVPVSSTKGVTGHTFGAAGAIEAILTILALRDGLLPATANLTDPDPLIELDLIAKEARACSAGAALSNSFGFGGYNASLLFTRP